MSRLTQLAGDYGRCTVGQVANGLLSVDCPVDGTTPTYLINDSDTIVTHGTPYEHTDDLGCSWTPPYAQ